MTSHLAIKSAILADGVAAHDDIAILTVAYGSTAADTRSGANTLNVTNTEHL